MYRWENRLRAFLCLLCTGVMLATPTGLSALADEDAALADEDAALATLRQSILDRCLDNNTDISMDDKIAAENGVNFTLIDSQFTPNTGDGDMCVDVYLNVTRAETFGDGYSLTLYDFVLAAFPEDRSTMDDMLLYTPAHVYDLTDDRLQELAWPVQFFQDRTLSLCLTYVVPKTLLQFGFLETNITGGDETDLQAAGPLYTFTFYRRAIDFNLVNNTELEIASLYAAPTEATVWGDELLGLIDIDSIPAGYWADIAMDKSPFADSDAATWTLKVDFTSGDSVTFGQIDLAGALTITLRQDGDSIYADMSN